MQQQCTTANTQSAESSPMHTPPFQKHEAKWELPNLVKRSQFKVVDHITLLATVFLFQFPQLLL